MWLFGKRRDKKQGVWQEVNKLIDFSVDRFCNFDNFDRFFFASVSEFTQFSFMLFHMPECNV